MLGELNPLLIEKGMLGKKFKNPPLVYEDPIPPRPPVCARGVPTGAFFAVLRKLKVFTNGDIGCYTLGAYPPLNGIHSTICMGSSIGSTHGMMKVLGEKGKRKVVGVIGDSTFLHSGIPSLMNISYNRSGATIIILDNRTTE